MTLESPTPLEPAPRTSRMRETPAKTAGELTPIHFASVLLRHWVLVLLLPFLVALITGVDVLLRERTYTAVTSFLPQSQGNSPLSGISGFAAQFGFQVDQPPGQSPDFYAALVKSRTVLRAVADSPYTAAGDMPGKSGRLYEVLNLPGGNAAQRRETAVDRLERMIQADVDPKSAIVRVAVKTKWPSLSGAIAQRVVQQVGDFNLRARQAMATSQEAFVRGRTEEAQAALNLAEKQLEDFETRNREYAGNPQLMLEYDRLRRGINLREQTYVALVQSLDRSSMEAMRNTPTISLVEPPVVPVEPDRRGLIAKVVVAIVLSGFIGILLAIFREYILTSAAYAPAEMNQLRAAWREFMMGLRHPLRSRAARHD